MPYQKTRGERHFSRRWVVMVTIICLLSSLGCRQLAKPEALAARLQKAAGAERVEPRMRRRLPTLTPTVYQSPTPWPTFTLPATPTPANPVAPTSPPPPASTPNPPATATPIPPATATTTLLPTNTPLPPAAATTTPLPTATPSPASAFGPAPPTATPSPTFTPEPGFAFQVAEIYTEFTSNLPGYVDIMAGAERVEPRIRRQLPTLTPTVFPSPAPLPTSTPPPMPADTATPPPPPTSTPIPPTATPMPLPTATPSPTGTSTPAPPTATPTATFTPEPAFDFQVAEIFKDFTSNSFLTGYVAIVTEQEIPIGGVKVVGHFAPGGAYHESPLSKWFLEGYSAPGEVIKSGSVKFEPPGGIQKGTWSLHLEDEWGTRLSEDVPIATDPDNREWFFVKFKELNSILVPTAIPVRVAATVPPSTGQPSAPAGAPTATPMATPAPGTSGWSFAGVQFRPFQRRGVVISGNIINNTGASQKIVGLTGTVTDSLGRVINVQGSQASWSNAVVPAGEQTSFELLVFGIQSVEDFDLGVISQ